MDDDRILAQAQAAMRCLGLRPNYPQTEEDLEGMFDEVKRAAIADWRDGKAISKRIGESSIAKSKIISALLDAAVMDYFKRENLVYQDMRASELKAGMFVMDLHRRGVVVVVVTAYEIGDKYDRAIRLDVIPHNGCSVGNLGTFGTLPLGRIVSAALGVSEMLVAQDKAPEVQDA